MSRRALVGWATALLSLAGALLAIVARLRSPRALATDHEDRALHLPALALPIALLLPLAKTFPPQPRPPTLLKFATWAGLVSVLGAAAHLLSTPHPRFAACALHEPCGAMRTVSALGLACVALTLGLRLLFMRAGANDAARGPASACRRWVRQAGGLDAVPATLVGVGALNTVFALSSTMLTRTLAHANFATLALGAVAVHASQRGLLTKVR